MRSHSLSCHFEWGRWLTVTNNLIRNRKVDIACWQFPLRRLNVEIHWMLTAPQSSSYQIIITFYETRGFFALHAEPIRWQVHCIWRRIPSKKPHTPCPSIAGFKGITCLLTPCCPINLKTCCVSSIANPTISNAEGLFDSRTNAFDCCALKSIEAGDNRWCELYGVGLHGC